MQTHFGGRSLKLGDNSVCKLFPAVQPNGTILVFVHGFGGHPLASWRSFDSLFLGSGNFSGVDIVFYEYDSIGTDAHANGAKLYRAISKFFEAKDSVIDKCLIAQERQRRGRKIEQVVLVGHSLGGALCRQVPIYAVDQNVQWRNRLKICLFAPAHNGAHIIQLLLSLGFGFFSGSLLASVASLRIPALRDLQHDSHFINKLHEDTDRLLTTYRNAALIADVLVQCDNDRVVINGRFCQDGPPTVFNKNHTEICKPCATFLDPFTLVEAII